MAEEKKPTRKTAKKATPAKPEAGPPAEKKNRPLRGRNNPSAIAEGSGASYAVGSFTKAARKPMPALECERGLPPLNDARP